MCSGIRVAVFSPFTSHNSVWIVHGQFVVLPFVGMESE